MQMIFGHDAALAEWVKSRIPYMRNGFGPCRAIGVAEGVAENNRFYAAVVYHNYVQQVGGWHTCEVSIAAISPRWAQKGIIRALLSVPFEQYGVNKLYSLMLNDNLRAIRFNRGIGFKQEAVLRHHFGKGKHAIVTSMLQKEYHRLYGDGRTGIVKSERKVVQFPCAPIQLPA